MQVDTSDVRPQPGVVPKHLTTRDVVSRWDVVEVHTRATSALAAQFLDSFQRRLPFPLRAVQVDGDSEFQAHFEALCQGRGVRLFVLPPPRSSSSTATWNGPRGLIRRSFMNSMTATWTRPP